MARPTISAVASAAGVSKGAVSLALNGRPGVSDETRARIRQIAADLNFRPSATARALSISRASAIGLVLVRKPEMLRSDSFFPSFLAGVESVLAAAGQSLVLRFVGSTTAEKAVYTELAHSGAIDGALVTDLRVADTRPALLGRLGLPGVTLNRPAGRSALPAVSLEVCSAVRTAIAALIALGHRRIGHISGPLGYLHTQERRACWADALAEAGLPPGLFVETDFTAAGSAAATRSLLDGPEPPTAVLYDSDLMAVAGMSVAQHRGLRLPQQLSVIGFDDAELSAHLHPPLATIRTDSYGWGVAAARTLLARLADPRAELPDVQMPPAIFVPRESAARPDT